MCPLSATLLAKALFMFQHEELKFSWELGAYWEGKKGAEWGRYSEGEEGGSGEQGRLVKPSL